MSIIITAFNCRLFFPNFCLRCFVPSQLVCICIKLVLQLCGITFQKWNALFTISFCFIYFSLLYLLCSNSCLSIGFCHTPFYRRSFSVVCLLFVIRVFLWPDYLLVGSCRVISSSEIWTLAIFLYKVADNSIRWRVRLSLMIITSSACWRLRALLII